MWLTCNDNGEIYLWSTKPVRHSEMIIDTFGKNIPSWLCVYKEWVTDPKIKTHEPNCWQVPSSFKDIPKITWEDEPLEVSINIQTIK